jgi:hypothetical protein
VHILGADVHTCAQCRCNCGGVQSSTDVAGVGAVLVQMWQGAPSLGADVAAVSPVPAQFWQGHPECCCRCGRGTPSAEARRAVRAGRFRASGRALPRRVCKGRCAPSVRRRACTTPRRPHTHAHTRTHTSHTSHVRHTHTYASARAHTHTLARVAAESPAAVGCTAANYCCVRIFRIAPRALHRGELLLRPPISRCTAGVRRSCARRRRSASRPICR